MKKVLSIIVLLLGFNTLISQNLSNVSGLKNETSEIFACIEEQLLPVSEKFNDDCIMALYWMAEDSTIYGMAMGDFKTEPKFYQLKYTNTTIEIKPRKVTNNRNSIFSHMDSTYIHKLKKAVLQVKTST